MLPYKPQTVSEHMKRWPAAILRVCDRRVQSFESYAPGMFREHVFDCHDGLRLIASTDRYDGGTHLHVSAGFIPETDVARSLEYGLWDFKDFCELVCKRARSIGGAEIVYGFKNAFHVPHFYEPALPKKITAVLEVGS